MDKDTIKTILIILFVISILVCIFVAFFNKEKPHVDRTFEDNPPH